MSGRPDIAAKLKGLDVERVLAFLKARWVMLVCATAVLAAPLVAWLLLDVVRQPIREEAKRRSESFEKLSGLERIAVEVKRPDGTTASEPTTLNEEIIRRVAAHNRRLGGGAEAIYLAAVERNRGHTDSAKPDSPRHHLIPGLEKALPAPDLKGGVSGTVVSKLQENEFRLLDEGRDALLAASGAGPAPRPADVLDHVQRAEEEYLAGTLRKKSRAEITDPKEAEALQGHLIDARKEFLGSHASGVAFYMDASAMNWPRFPAAAPSQSDGPSKGPSLDRVLSTMFLYQWDLWLVDDVLQAIAHVNAPPSQSTSASRGPMVAPVKRVLMLSLDSIGQPTSDPSSGAAPGTEAETEAAPAAGGEAIDAKVAVTPDFTVSVTGLKSNQLFDVRRARLVVVIETAAIPALIDALARQNFISVTGIAMRPADAFAAAREGYVYGPQSCSEVTLDLESVWFRAWVTERMPAAMRQALNTAGPPAKESPAGEAVPTEGSPG